MEIFDLFEQDELVALRELEIDPKDLVFDRKPLLPFGKSRRFVCHLRVADGLYSFDYPDDSPRKFKKQIFEIQFKLRSLNNSAMRRLMENAKKNALFIERFNSELFLKHSFFQGRRITTGELFDFYETHPYYQTINLSSDPDKQPFIALYAMTFYACSIEDLFTIDGIFSMQPERHADNAKKTAGNAVFNLVLRDNKEEIRQVLMQMGQSLIKIPPLRVNISDAVMLSKNYTLFGGLAEMGRAFSEVAAPHCDDGQMQEALQAARNLTNYAPLVKLCDTISVLCDDEDYRETAVYSRCKELF